MPGRSKRLRIIAGPNGSGKSTFIDTLRKSFNCGVYVNTDEIEKTLRDTGFVNLNNYLIDAPAGIFDAFIEKESSRSLINKAEADNIPINLYCVDNIIVSADQTNSYEAALVGDFIKHILVESNQILTFEFAHPKRYTEQPSVQGELLGLPSSPTLLPGVEGSNVVVRIYFRF